MVECIAAFMECCYIAHRNAITSSDLQAFEQHQVQFQDLRNVSIENGVQSSISLPCQHVLLHYVSKIELFASPNGVCSSITESKHIQAVKEPWRWSSCFNALPQMVATISRLDKLAALRWVFHNRGMIEGMLSQYTLGVISGTLPQILPYGAPNDKENASNDCDDDSDGGPLSGPKALVQVTLTLTPGEHVTSDIVSAVSTHPYVSERGYPKMLEALAVYIK